MSNITELIIQNIEKSSNFNNRYHKLKCINYDPDPSKREGVFSLIFIAEDKILDEEVVIKVFDPACLDAYRMQCFEREATLLEKVLNKKRCLQLKKAVNTYDFELEIAVGQKVPLQIKYFVTEYLPISIIKDFYDNKQTKDLSTKSKLQIFRQIVLSVRALHNYEIFHRDLKPDNLRGYEEGLKTIVVAIDFGTAVHTKMKNIKSSYSTGSVGAGGYSSPESYSGLAGNRDIDFLTDFYSLGCMLYELFNYDFLFQKIHDVNGSTYFNLLNYCRSQIALSKEKVEKWHEMIDLYQKNIKYPEFDKFNCDIPIAIIPTLNSLLHDLIQFDYRKRLTDFELIIKKIDTCIKILEHHSYQKYLLKKKKIYRENRIRKMINNSIKRNQLLEQRNA